MPRHRSLSRLTVWAFAGALLLKSAVPILASTAAALQGKAVAEICDVYGVATVPLRAAPATPGGAHAHHHGDASAAALATPAEHAAAHDHGAHGKTHGDDAPPAPSHGAKAGDHCVLSGMVAVGGGDVPAFARLAPTVAASQALASGEASVFDAVARWAALLEHGPPALS